MTRGILRFMRGNIVGLLALFVALGGTTYAASSALLPNNSVGTKQVVNGSLQTKDLSKQARKALKGNRGLRGLTGAQGAQGATGAQGAKGDKGDTGAQGAAGTARAFGSVFSSGSPTTYAGTRMKNATVTRPATGVYCITLSGGVDPSTTIPVVSTDFSSASSQAIAQIRSSGIGCAAGQLAVYTWNASTGAAENAGFSFVIP
jgi:hypothetical protein